MSLINKNIINAITFRLNELENLDERLNLLTEIFIYTKDLRYDLSSGADQVGEEQEADSVEAGSGLLEQENQNDGDVLHAGNGDENARGDGFDYQTGLPL